MRSSGFRCLLDRPYAIRLRFLPGNRKKTKGSIYGAKAEALAFSGAAQHGGCCRLFGGEVVSLRRNITSSLPAIRPFGTKVDSVGKSDSSGDVGGGGGFGDDGDDGDDDRRPILYKRSLSRRTFPRFILAMTSAQSIYWLWYVIDFTPAMNSAAAARASALYAEGATAAEVANATAAATVDPVIGYAGLGLAIMMSSMSLLYPRHLISEIRMAEGEGSVAIKVHDLPFVTAEEGRGTLHTRGMATIDNSGDLKKVINDLGGDISLFRGHLGVKAPGSRGNLLLNIGEGDTVNRGDILLKSLLPSGMTLPKKATVGAAPKRRRGKDSELKRKLLEERRWMQRKQS